MSGNIVLLSDRPNGIAEDKVLQSGFEQQGFLANTIDWKDCIDVQLPPDRTL